VLGFNEARGKYQVALVSNPDQVFLFSATNLQASGGTTAID
jgi:hypothetical protein